MSDYLFIMKWPIIIFNKIFANIHLVCKLQLNNLRNKKTGKITDYH